MKTTKTIGDAVKAVRDESASELEGMSVAEYDRLTDVTRRIREAKAAGWVNNGGETMGEFYARTRAERIAANPEAAKISAKFAAWFAK